MTYLLRKCNEAKESLKTQKIKNHEFGKDGPNMQNRLDSAKIFGSPLCSQSNTLTLLPPLLPPCTEDNFLDHTTKTWLCQQYKRPWQNWVRSLGQTWGTTPHMDADQTLCTHYLPGNFEAVVSSLGPNRLGFTADEIGTHSNRTGGSIGLLKLS
jgi:hypothetical protein